MNKNKLNEYYEDLESFNLVELYKALKPKALLFFIPLLPVMVIAWIVWIVLCTGMFFISNAFKDF